MIRQLDFQTFERQETDGYEKIWWLIGSFLWGISNLVLTRALSNGEKSDWTFGQVLPVVLLAAPLLAVFEHLYPGKHRILLCAEEYMFTYGR